MHLTNKNIHYTKREYSAHLENQMHTNKYLTKDKQSVKQLADNDLEIYVFELS